MATRMEVKLSKDFQRLRIHGEGDEAPEEGWGLVAWSQVAMDEGGFHDDDIMILDTYECEQHDETKPMAVVEEVDEEDVIVVGREDGSEGEGSVVGELAGSGEGDSSDGEGDSSDDEVSIVKVVTASQVANRKKRNKASRVRKKMRTARMRELSHACCRPGECCLHHPHRGPPMKRKLQEYVERSTRARLQELLGGMNHVIRRSLAAQLNLGPDMVNLTIPFPKLPSSLKARFSKHLENGQEC